MNPYHISIVSEAIKTIVKVTYKAQRQDRIEHKEYFYIISMLNMYVLVVL